MFCYKNIHGLLFHHEKLACGVHDNIVFESILLVLELCNIALSIGVAGDEVGVEVETWDLDLFFDWVNEQGELSNLSTRLLQGVIAINCMVVG
jgi:hypothetical protein